MSILIDLAPSLISLVAGFVAGGVSKEPAVRRLVASAVEQAGTLLLRRAMRNAANSNQPDEEKRADG